MREEGPLASMLEQIIWRISGDNVDPCFHMLEISIESEFMARCELESSEVRSACVGARKHFSFFHLIFKLVIGKCQGQT